MPSKLRQLSNAIANGPVLRWAVTTFLAGHVALVASFSTGFPSSFGLLDSVFRPYGEWTGIATSYNFFAPSVASQTRVRITGLDREGEERSFILSSGDPEIDLRLMTMTSIIPLEGVEPKVMRSIAAWVFNNGPRIDHLKLNLEYVHLPGPGDISPSNSAQWVIHSSYEYSRTNF